MGKVQCTGLVEVPLGTTLRKLIFDIGGGVLGGRDFKAVQTGGPSGGCIPAAMLDTPVDYDSLKAAGSIMGSGGMVVMDDTTCMVDFARYFLDFVQKESCGECPPCRLGTRQMLDILQDITEGKGQPEDIDLLLQLARASARARSAVWGRRRPIRCSPRCVTSATSTKPTSSQKRCPAVVCKEIISSPCQHVCPIETQAPVYIGLLADGPIPGGVCRDRRGQPAALGLRPGLPSPLRVELPGGPMGPADRRAGDEACGRGLCGQGGPLSVARAGISPMGRPWPLSAPGRPA